MIAIQSNAGGRQHGNNLDTQWEVRRTQHHMGRHRTKERERHHSPSMRSQPPNAQTEKTASNCQGCIRMTGQERRRSQPRACSRQMPNQERHRTPLKPPTPSRRDILQLPLHTTGYDFILFASTRSFLCPHSQHNSERIPCPLETYEIGRSRKATYSFSHAPLTRLTYRDLNIRVYI